MNSVDAILSYLNPDKTIYIPVLNSGTHFYFGLALALQKMMEPHGCKVKVAVEDIEQYGYLSFLDMLNVEVGFPTHRETVIRFNVVENSIDSLKYDIEGEYLNIYLTSQKSQIKLEDLQLIDSGAKPDLLITIGIPRLHNLGVLYTSSPEIFSNTPIVNLDNTFENKAYGTLNIIEVGIPLVSQLVYEFAKTLGLDVSLGATELMWSLMEETDNFQSSNTPSVAYQLAGELVMLGAKRDDIIATIYRNKPLSLLKLMGRTMAHGQYFPLSGKLDGKEIFYTKLYPHDFQKTDTTEDDIAEMVRDLSEHIPLSVVGIHILIETGNSIKTGYATFKERGVTNKAMHVLGGSLVRGVIKYTFPTQKDVHSAIEEVNILLAEAMYE